MARYRIEISPDGRLSRVVESYQAVELAQLEQEQLLKQKRVDELQAERDRIDKAYQTELDRIDTQLKEATSELEDSKSELADGRKLVVESPAGVATAPETQSEDGTSGVVAYQEPQPEPIF